MIRPPATTLGKPFRVFLGAVVETVEFEGVAYFMTVGYVEVINLDKIRRDHPSS
jgi:hypothetical protein